MEYIPRTNFPFTLQQYKEDFGKPFSKIDLYLCKTCMWYHETRNSYYRQWIETILGHVYTAIFAGNDTILAENITQDKKGL